MKNSKRKIIINFKKAQSLIARNTENVKSCKYCVDVMQQNLAAIGLLRSAHQTLMKNHLNNCFKQVIEAKNEKRRRKMVIEIQEVTKLFKGIKI